MKLRQDIRLPRIRRAGPPVVVPLVSPVRDAHALALALGAPALFETGSPPEPTPGREPVHGFHVVPLAPRGALVGGEGRVRLEWGGDVVHEGPGRALDALRALTTACSCPHEADASPFPGGLITLLGYELAHEIERLPGPGARRDDFPWLWAAACPAAVIVRLDGEAWLTALAAGRDDDGLPWGLSAAEIDHEHARVSAALTAPPAKTPRGGPTGPVQPLVASGEHQQRVRQVLEHLRAGDIYQANLSQPFEVPWSGSLLPLHDVLRARNPSPMSGWARLAGPSGKPLEIVVNSPERLVRLRGQELLTEPIAGTFPLPQGPATSATEVARLARDLAASRKDAAEHVMIVDIHRNDLGRVSAPGSVHVPALMRVDRRSHVLQAVADIRGTLAEGCGAVDVIEAVFPGGCITGVPKVRCMEILHDLERAPRGPYTGAFGMLSALGDMDLAVVIRSAWTSRRGVSFAAGGGIVLDSDPAAEERECLAKAQALLEAVAALAAGEGAPWHAGPSPP